MYVNRRWGCGMEDLLKSCQYTHMYTHLHTYMPVPADGYRYERFAKAFVIVETSFRGAISRHRDFSTGLIFHVLFIPMCV